MNARSGRYAHPFEQLIMPKLLDSIGSHSQIGFELQPPQSMPVERGNQRFHVIWSIRTGADDGLAWLRNEIASCFTQGPA